MFLYAATVKNVSKIILGVIEMAVDKQGNEINYCEIPSDIKSEKEVKIYKILLKSHCSHKDKSDPDHECCGQLSITRKHLTASCVKCGDSRSIFK